MKQELTFAVVLLAIGCLLWGPGLIANFQSETGENASVLAESNDQDDVIDLAGTFDSSVVGASFHSQTNPSTTQKSDSVSGQKNSLPQKSNESAKPPTQNKQSNLQSMRLLETVANQLAESEPFSLNIQMDAELFGQRVAASGRYFQMGQGTHKTRIELTFQTMPQKPSLLQVCDGRFLYTVRSVQQNQAEPSFDFVDLVRVQQAAGEKGSKITPTGWVATGGLSSLIQHLASAFNFGLPEPLSDDLVLIRGSWNEKALRTIVANADNNLDLGSPIDWERVPRQLPHAVELVLKRTATQGYLPRQVSYFRFENVKGQIQTKPTFVMGFSEQQFLDNLAEGFFVVDSSNLATNDKTDQYIDRIHAFHEAKQAALESSTIGR